MANNSTWVRNSNEIRSLTFIQRAERSLMLHRHVDEATGCWLWTGYRLKDGHGQLHIQGKCYCTHRIAAYLWLGLDITNRYVGSRRDKSQVNHKCSNPSCFNPKHLYIGTQRENINDIDHSKRRLPQVCEKGHPFTPETYTKHRGCHICRQAYLADYYKRNRARIKARQQAWRARQREQAA